MGILCLACGLCCDGTLFRDVPLSVGEARAIGSLLPIFPRNGVSRLRQPCAALAERCCIIYDHRPSRCRTYSCELYRDVERGDVTAAEAHSIVAEATALAARIRSLLGEADGSLWDAADAALLRLERSQQRDDIVESMASLNTLLLERFDRNAAQSRDGQKNRVPGMR